MNKTEQKTLVELLEELPDERKGNALKHKLAEVIMIGILCIMCNGMTFTAMELFGKTHEKELREFMELPHGIPSHDTFRNIFSRLDPEAVSGIFDIFLGDMKEELKKLKKEEKTEHVISVDGKTIRHSGNKKHKAYHVITAFCSDLQLVLGQMTTEEKSNEITAIPKLLETLLIEGCTVTIDAMGTQRDIATLIKEKGADYILSLKGNQSDLQESVQEYIKSELEDKTEEEFEKAGQFARTTEKGHGRKEIRECWVFPDMSWYDRTDNWTGLAGCALVRSTRTLPDKTTTEDRLFIYSRETLTAKEFLSMQRSHWAIENSLHWVLDVTFKEDSANIRFENAAIVLNMFRKYIMQLLKADTSVKGSMKSKLLRCSWDFCYALSVLKNA